MSLWKRGKQYRLDAIVHGHRYREPLGTTDWREAKRLERQRIEQLRVAPRCPPPIASRMRPWTWTPPSPRMPKSAAPRSRNGWPPTGSRTLGRSRLFSRTRSSGTSTPAQLAAYQNARTDAGRAPKTINGELSVMRQILKRAKLWYRFSDEYATLRNRKPPVGRALTPEEQERLFALARTRPTLALRVRGQHARSIFSVSS